MLLLRVGACTPLGVMSMLYTTLVYNFLLRTGCHLLANVFHPVFLVLMINFYFCNYLD